MAFTRPATGENIQAQHITQITDAWEGVSGSGNRVQNVQVSDSSNYVEDIQNLDSTNSYGLRVRDSSSNVIATFALAAVTLGKKLVMTGLGTFTTAANMLDIAATWNGAAASFNAIKAVITNTASAATSWIITLQTASATVFGVTIGGKAFLNDDANTNMTQGLTINQGASDDEILAFKSSDVAHGITTATETDTFGTVDKLSAIDGGMRLRGLSEGTGLALILDGVNTTDDGTRSTVAVAPIHLRGFVKSGTTAVACSANNNLAVIQAGSTTRFIFDSDGDSHQDVGTAWTTFDTHDDVALLTALSAEVSRDGDPIRQEFGYFLKERRTELEEAKLVRFNDGSGQDGHAFVNMSKLLMLTVGAVRQVGRENAALRTQLAEIHRMLSAPAAGA